MRPLKMRFSLACLLLLFVFVFRINAQQTEVQYLSGHGKDDAVPWKFFCTTNAQSGFWTNLSVPSCWELHGFGKINYHRDATNSYDERGLYETEFSVSENWRGKKIFLVFDGSMTDTSAKLNGQSCGPTHQGAYYQFKYEVTPLVKFGATNKLEVEVAKHSANTSVNGAERTGDYWMYGGIFRPVYLEAVPQQFIERVAVDAKADGKFSAQVFCGGVSNAPEIEVEIQTLDGQKVQLLNSGTVYVYGDGRPDSSNLKLQISSPKLWTAETPNLYKAILRLKQNGKVVHEVSQRFGFRTFEVRDGDGLYLNGQRVILKGADRHSFWPDSGRTLSEAVHRLDIETMKDMNMNAVRMSHYPPDAEFLDLCDELGLYVLDELSGWHKFYDNETGARLVKEMVTRDANHPSILFWDNGNEGGFNTNLDHIFSQYDFQNRRVLHPWSPFSGVNTVHYLPYDKAKLACDGIALSYHKSDYLVETNSAQKWIYMPTEFMHGLYDGGAGAGLADVWDLMSHSKYLGGGFIWALLDEGIKRADNGQIDVSGNEAPDGIVGPYREREANFYTVKQIWSPIQITREPLAGNFSFKVENHFSFTDTKDCKFTWEWRRFPKLGEAGTNFTVVSSGVFKSPEIPPGGVGKLEFEKIPPAVGDALAVRASDPTGRELWTWIWPKKNDDASRLADGPAAEHAVPAETNGVITIHTGDLTATFSKQTGWLLGVQRGEQFFSLTNGPRPAVGSAPLKEIHFDDDGPDAFVSAKYDGALKSVLWRVYNNGWIQCSYDYHAEGTNDFLGVIFDYPENLVKSKRWLGDGPYRVWKNRLEGEKFGLWQNDYNNTITGWRDWIYPEFKGCFAGVRWLQLDTDEGEISVVNVSGVPFFQVLTPEFPPAKLAGYTAPPLPICGLGLLDAIPAMGSKFQRAENNSPSGARTVAQGDYHGTVSFYFGRLPAN
jgi:Glycosyl hydrolases family 2, TIM barrel domain/Glycosyl hydrolases family 2, sugar binding domain/Glycosyl hydrolases family 2/Beta galactosidase small chain